MTNTMDAFSGWMSFHEYISSNKVQVWRGWIADFHQWRHAMRDDNANLCDPAITQMAHTMETFLLECVLLKYNFKARNIPYT